MKAKTLLIGDNLRIPLQRFADNFTRAKLSGDLPVMQRELDYVLRLLEAYTEDRVVAAYKRGYKSGHRTGIYGHSNKTAKQLKSKGE